MNVRLIDRPRVPVGVPARLRRLRTSAGLTQMALAIEAGISQAAVSEFERGVSAPRADTLADLAQALGVSVEQLAYGEQE